MKADGEGRISEFKEEVYIPRGSRGIPTWLMGRKSYRSCKLFCATKVEKTRKRHNKNGQRQKKNSSKETENLHHVVLFCVRLCAFFWFFCKCSQYFWLDNCSRSRARPPPSVTTQRTECDWCQFDLIYATWLQSDDCWHSTIVTPSVLTLTGCSLYIFSRLQPSSARRSLTYQLQ